ncbi:MAG: acyl-CoA dehydrogenase family protein [Saprospiraceae bacterium]|nr:acyl-CoA dehydrogenase family protein [Saprospiraceae bacterium]
MATTDTVTFKSEVRDFIEANCPEALRKPVKKFEDYFWGGKKSAGGTDEQIKWFNAMKERGWTVPHWPKEYGGGGLSAEENKIFLNEMAKAGARKPLFSFGISMLGPALLKFGNEAQKKEHLTKIANGEIWWCQGYSEPGAGSDLAALQTRAEDKGDHYLVNGQKVWTSYADKADWIFCLVRTDPNAPKHSGISFLLIDMESEGVSTRPIKLISGKSPFCETFFDNVKVPKENLVGKENMGWSIATFLLTHERSMIGGIGDTDVKQALHDFALGQMGSDDNGKLADPLLRKEIAEIELDARTLDMTIQRSLEEAKSGKPIGARSSFFKYAYTEINKRRYEAMVAAAGVNGLGWEGEKYNDGAVAKQFCRTKGNSIEGGTSEVQLNIIAKRILHLRGKK